MYEWDVKDLLVFWELLHSVVQTGSHSQEFVAKAWCAEKNTQLRSVVWSLGFGFKLWLHGGDHWTS